MATLTVAVSPATNPDGSAHSVAVAGQSKSTDANGKASFYNLQYGDFPVTVCGADAGVARANKPLVIYPVGPPCPGHPT